MPVSSAAAQSTATIASTDVKKKRMHVRAGKPVVVTGAARPGTAGVAASLRIKREGRWRTLDRARTGADGRYTLRDRVPRPMSAPARVRVATRVAGSGGSTSTGRRTCRGTGRGCTATIWGAAGGSRRGGWASRTRRCRVERE
ncbi:MAG TPA: hypothetical protein VHJ39_16960 [Solirubrobacteraceae bacterium]|nr:hypothetical protein [Solirubrobacteraceae bacterium]